MGIVSKTSCLLATILTSVSTVNADIYVYQDASDVIHYTNVRPAPHIKIDRIISDQTGLSTKVPHVSPPPLIPAPEVDAILKEAASALSVDHRLVHAVIQTESAFNPKAVSPKGARGLMQLMPQTAKRYGVLDLFDPAQNIWGGVRYLRDLLQQFNFDVTLALAAYNAGEQAVLRYGGVPPYNETRNYVQKVVALQRQL